MAENRLEWPENAVDGWGYPGWPEMTGDSRGYTVMAKGGPARFKDIPDV